jgi:hypothetical protein
MRASEDENRAVARRITFELFASGDLSLMEELTALDFVNHGQTPGVPDREGRTSLAAPTGRLATWREVHVMRFAAGRMVEQWGVVDRLSVLQQLGLLSA